MERLQIEYKVKLSQEVLDGLDTDVAMFANTRGGEIWFGVDNKGNTIGAQLTAIDRDRIAQRAAKCRPPISIDYEEREHEGKMITVVIVPVSTSVHMDEKHRVPIRIGGIKDYLDVTGILLLARERGLEFSSGDLMGVSFPPAQKLERSELPAEIAEHLLLGMRSQEPSVRAEALKDLEGIIYLHLIERDERVMAALLDQTTSLDSEVLNARPFDLLSYLLSRSSDEDKNKWVPLVREKAMAIWQNMQPPAAVQQAMNFLSQFPQIGDVDIIVSYITTLRKDLYAQAQPLHWLREIKNAGYPWQIQRRLLTILEETQDGEIRERIRGCLEFLRRN